jgi:hypothetical protein
MQQKTMKKKMSIIKINTISQTTNLFKVVLHKLLLSTHVLELNEFDCIEAIASSLLGRRTVVVIEERSVE